MTEKRALEKTIKMWKKLKELYEQDNKSFTKITELKFKYFCNITKNNPFHKVPEDGCYLCEYAESQCTGFDDDRCFHCPIKNWSVLRKDGKTAEYCTSQGSVYTLSPLKNKIGNVLELLEETYNNLYNCKEGD